MTLKIGHRGAAGYAPENTLLSLQKAIDMGVDGIECDVHVCKSGEAVVIHDATLNRTTNGKGKVANHTLAQLKKLDAGEGEEIPTLEEYITALKGRILFIEIKDPRAVKEVARVIRRCVEKKGLKYEQLPVISFLWDALMEIKSTNPRILIGASPKTKPMPKTFAARAKAAGMWSANPCIDKLTQATVDNIRKHGLKMFVWTANTPAKISKAKKLKVDGIMSDYPDLLK